MILSMTSFARREKETALGGLRWEMRSVNHRYLDLSLRVPDDLRVLETRVREMIAERLSRGKVECSLRYQPLEQGAAFAIDHEMVRRVANAVRDAAVHVSDPGSVNMLDLLKWPGVLHVEKTDLEPLYVMALELLDETLDDMIDSRAREGEKLKAVIEQRCDTINQLVAQVSERLPGLRQGLRQKLEQRLGELRDQLDPGRIEQEIALLAQKMDVDEEVDRLAAHVQEVRNILQRDEPVGRRLDFLMQELNREANTLASKSIDAEVTRISVDLKVLIEQIREQVQNIE